MDSKRPMQDMALGQVTDSIDSVFSFEKWGWCLPLRGFAQSQRICLLSVLCGDSGSVLVPQKRLLEYPALALAVVGKVVGKGW